MKSCPTCHRTFVEEHLIFCTEDGTPLRAVDADETPADETTQVRSSSRPDESSGGAVASSSSENGAGEPSGAAYQPPGSYVPPGYTGQPKSKAWPWIVGVLAIAVLAITGLGIAGAMLYRNVARQNANVDPRNDNAVNLNQNSSNINSNSNSNSTNGNENSNAAIDDTTPPPTDSAKVLADLKQLEDQWTVANIKADKKELNRILADDYVGVTEGRAQGKAQYLKTIEPDNAIQHWEFENLKVSLNGDRASLTGVLRLDVKDNNDEAQQLTFRFTDKFVWREGRWQAIGSEVEPVPVKPGTAV
ncbi:MAG TPA: DUF4440 domain-containing protein [Pyrinomonadaceae bacterium]|nr:DUF4440 domain-containing protein [Pyrinomonadaceae bacterium]